MNKRTDSRVTVKMQVECFAGSVKYPGVIENVSPRGLFIRTSATNTVSAFTPGNVLEVRFETAPEKIQVLKCKIRWLYSQLYPDGLQNCIGMEISNPPFEYIEFLKTI
jgi:hypothetical protein